MMIKWFIWSWCIKHIPHQQPTVPGRTFSPFVPQLSGSSTSRAEQRLWCETGIGEGFHFFFLKKSNLKVKSIIFVGLYARMKDIMERMRFCMRSFSAIYCIHTFFFGKFHGCFGLKTPRMYKTQVLLRNCWKRFRLPSDSSRESLTPPGGF